MQFRPPKNPPSKLGRRPPLDTVIYPFLRKTCGFPRETRSGSDYGSEGLWFNSTWVHHLSKQELTKTLRSPMANKLQKVEGEPLLYQNPASKVYFLRKHDAQRDTHVSLKT